MSALDKFWWVCGGVVAILMLSSSISFWLSRRVSSDSGRATVQNLNARINAWWVMIAVVTFAFLLGKAATIILFALISFYALREFLTLTPTRAGDHRAMSVAFFGLIPAQYLLIGYDWYTLFSIFIPVYGFLLLPTLSVLGEDVENFLDRSAKIQWGVMITIYCISHVPALLLLEIPGYSGQNVLLIFYFLLVVQISDVLQYVFGKLFGKHKIAPIVSPSKTVEGFVGGTLGATAIGAAMWWITPFSPLQAGALAAVAVLMGFLGGLVLSAVKRSLNAKDWGAMISGHGGMMDRMDSISFAAPVFFHLTRYFFTP